MPFGTDDLTNRGAVTDQATEEIENVPVDDLLYLLAEGVLQAQTKLDLNTAEVMEVLADTEVEVVPSITRHVEEDGSVRIESEDPEPRSMLELGFTPTRYQFSEATVEASFDISIAEATETTEEGETESPLYALRASTYEIEQQRKLNREVEANASVTATLEPVPMPVDASPTAQFSGEGTDEE